MSATGRARRTRNTHGKGGFPAGVGHGEGLSSPLAAAKPRPRRARQRQSRKGREWRCRGGRCPRAARSPRASPPPGGRPLPAPGAQPGAALLLRLCPRRLRRRERGFSGRRGNVALGAAGAAGAAGPRRLPLTGGPPRSAPPAPGRGHLAPAHLSRPRNFPRAARFERGCAERDPRGTRRPRPPRPGPVSAAPSASAGRPRRVHRRAFGSSRAVPGPAGVRRARLAGSTPGRSRAPLRCGGAAAGSAPSRVQSALPRLLAFRVLQPARAFGNVRSGTGALRVFQLRGAAVLYPRPPCHKHTASR